MNYSIRLIKSTCYTPTYWSGGMASELITYPDGSSFADRNFLWRIGCAKIDVDTSTFSSLPDIKRHLMVTDGEMTLSHQDRYSKLLKPFNQDFFMGDWTTTTKGRCSVLNLMTRGNYDGILTHINIMNETTSHLKFTHPENSILIAVCIYPLNGNVTIHIDNNHFDINKCDLLYIDIRNFNLFPGVELRSSKPDNVDLVSCAIFKYK